MTQAYNLSQLANFVNTSGQVDASAGLDNAVPIANGGTGSTDATNAKSALEVITSATGSQIVPVGDTAQRDDPASAGYFRFNTDNEQFEGYNGTSWGSIGGGATGAGGDQVFVENSMVVTTTYSIPIGKSASSVGPISIDSGVIVTVPSNSRWIVF
jgi:hypothetical protein